MQLVIYPSNALTVYMASGRDSGL